MTADTLIDEAPRATRRDDVVPSDNDDPIGSEGDLRAFGVED